MIVKMDYLVVIFSVSVSNICMGRDVGIESDYWGARWLQSESEISGNQSNHRAQSQSMFVYIYAMLIEAYFCLSRATLYWFLFLFVPCKQVLCLCLLLASCGFVGHMLWHSHFCFILYFSFFFWGSSYPIFKSSCLAILGFKYFHQPPLSQR